MSLIRLTDTDGNPGPEFVVGLHWDTLSKGDWKRQKKTAKESGTAFVEIPVTAGDSNTINIGTINRSDLGSSKYNLSLAAWLARSFKTGTIIAVERVTHGQEQAYWMCAVNQGQVITNTDILGDWDEVDTLVTEIAEMLATQGDIGFIGADTEALTANSSGDATATPLIAGLPKSAKKKAAIQIPGQMNRMVVIGGGATVAALVIGIGGWLAIDALTGTDNAERLRQQRLAQMQRAEQAYRDLQTDLVARLNGAKHLEALYQEKLAPLQTKIDGWSLIEGECSMRKCDLTYENENLTDPQMLLDGIGEVCNEVTVSPEGVSGTCVLKVEDSGSKAATTATPTLLNGEGVKQLRSALMKYARYVDGAGYTISEPAPVSFSGQRYLKDVQVYEEGAWGLSVPIKYLPMAIQLMQEFEAISFDEATLNWQNKTMDISGSYYKEGDSR
ncbi:MAG: Uncharacterized protein AWU57_521 [Marinobacter sp. T13-3]|nr:MAG: Uncharacterized protein AWU57_521 [Marinobacter sp. T13-3]